MNARPQSDGVVDKQTTLRDAKLAKVKKVVNLALLALLVWFLASHQQTMRSNIQGRDSTLYWATAKLLVHGGNPYSVPDILALEEAQGFASGKPKMYRPPPWSLWMILPLGMLSPYWAWVVWMAIAMLSLVIAIRITWRIYGDGPNPPPVFLLAAYLFAPVAACLVMAQMGTVLLLGIVLFFLLVEERPHMAAAALLLPMAKPHFFALLWLILLVWAITRKKWSLLWGMALAFLCANAVAVAFDPAIFQHYREMLRLDKMNNEFMPNLSGMFRLLFFRRLYWVQFVPVGLGMLWSARYYWKSRQRWNWPQHGPWLLVVGALVAPYSWMTDEVALLPAVLQGVLWLHGRELKLRSQFAILLFVCLNLLLLLIVRAKVDSFTGIYFWSGLVWFSWYWYAYSVSQTVVKEV